MAEIYSINQKPAPQMQVVHKNHLAVEIVALVVIVILGLIYWFYLSSRPKPATPIVQEQNLREQVAAMLKSSSAQSSPEDVSRVASLLSQSKSSSTVDGQAQAAEMLRSSSSEH